MDRGAHFYKCDLQVHTPRDINWQGDSAVTDEDRRAYAAEFVATCRSKALQAVAITDHHDIAFFKYIRAAALSETDAAGMPLETADRLVVFPGLELTLGIPCQALLIFDADLAPEFLPLALTALGITPSSDSADKHAPVKKLDFMSFDDLYTALNKLDPLRNHFVVFPHVGDGGYKTLLRKDFEKHYISMPCVGGYVDGPLPVAPKSAGMRSITSGQDKNWGNKPLGVFQTSDCRRRDFATLGEHPTWVKWSQPTAEALRQACLARHSRIAHAEPQIPPIQITRIEVSNSKFLGPIALDLNPQYNAVIGGRGTGKSSILEYIRWALCDQPPGPSDTATAEFPDFQRRRQSLIEDTLLPLDAVVDVAFLLNGVSHVVRRRASGELSLKIGDSPFQVCTELNVRELLPVQAYSQKQLGAVGARLDELRRFLQAPIQGRLDSFTERIESLRADLRTSFDRVVRHRALQAELESHSIERTSVERQIETLRSSLKGLSPEDRDVIDRQASYEAGRRIVQAIERDENAGRTSLSAVLSQFRNIPTSFQMKAGVPHNELLQQSHTTLRDWSAEVQRIVVDLLSAFEQPVADKSLARYFSGIEEWKRLSQAHAAQYDSAKTRATAHDETLRQIQALELRIGELNESADAKTEQLRSLGDPLGDFSQARIAWNAVHRARGDVLEEQCQHLTSIAKSRLRATLRRASDVEALDENLRQLLKGTKTRGDRVDKLVEQVATSPHPPVTWSEILDELQALAWIHIEDEAITQLPAVSHLDNAGFTKNEKIALARKIDPASWLTLLLLDLNDLPVFDYEVRPDDFLAFEKASPGQQATALLSILLMQEGPPLLIDQPEDDLNMKIINEIVEMLWRAKTHRQLLFSSHNANLVVNGDTELVVCCDYRMHATESGGQVKLAGAIDVPQINAEIADVMEGGVAAFKLRQQKYGF